MCVCLHFVAAIENVCDGKWLLCRCWLFITNFYFCVLSVLLLSSPLLYLVWQFNNTITSYKETYNGGENAERASYKFPSFFMPLFSMHYYLSKSTKNHSRPSTLDHVLGIFGIHTVYVYHMPFAKTINTYWELKRINSFHFHSNDFGQLYCFGRFHEFVFRLLASRHTASHNKLKKKNQYYMSACCKIISLRHIERYDSQYNFRHIFHLLNHTTYIILMFYGCFFGNSMKIIKTIYVEY